MSDDADLEGRVEALERQMGEVSQRVAGAAADAEAARVMAAGADRDVSEVRAELRAHTSVLNALRETQIEQGRVLEQHSEALLRHDRMFERVQGGVDQIIRILSPDDEG